MSMVALIDTRARGDRMFQASLHGMRLADDGAPLTSSHTHNRSHSAMERMKKRRKARGDR